MNLFRRCLSLFALALLPVAPLASQVPLAPGVSIAHPDHHEFEAALWAPFLGEQGEARTLKVGFGFVDAETMTVGSWRLELVDAKGLVRRIWHGETFLVSGAGTQRIAWDGADAAGRPLEHGFYTLRLTAKPTAQAAYRQYPNGSQIDRVEAQLAANTEEVDTQDTPICIGPVPRLKVRALDMPVSGALAPGSAPAPASLPYTIYLGNLHSQTNHSDGGVVVTSCTGGENPQSGTQGPAQAYEMMRVAAGGDFLAATEHNHMYDGSTGTGDLDPAIPKALFDSGVSAASAYRTANPTFMATYGVEWGVIANGGHLNIFNPDGLPTWEFNTSGQLMGHFNTPKNDYPALYLTMQSRNWVGQFNHPKTSQFNNLTYTAAGDEVVALCEVSNSGAFSTSLTESDPFLSNFEIPFNAFLEKGFHVSPTSNQDNHCANWGLSNINRTGLLIPNGTPWTLTAMLDAIRARRTFATHDKGSQIVLTTSAGAMMGDRINNTGSLTLQVHYATVTPGRSASRIQIFEGIPGIALSTVQMIEGTDTATITPAAGNHYYYAKITQDDGRFLWSAPIWVNQAASAVAANITQPATNTTVLDGATVNFTGTATTTHTAITGHSWNFGDGSPVVTGTATPSHTFNNATGSPVLFTVTYTATDDAAATGSATRLITVQPFGVTNTPPTISDIPNQSTLKDIPVNNLGFSIGDAETNANLLTVTGSSNNQTLLPDANITFGGSGASRTITLVPAADQTGSATVTVTVTDGAGDTATDTFIFNVNAPGGSAPKLIISQYYEGTGSNKHIEITNVGPTPLDLASPQIYLALYSNLAADDPTAPPTIPPVSGGIALRTIRALTGVLASGASMVFRNGSAVLPAYTSAYTIDSSVINFNGDDLVILTTNNANDNVTPWTNRFDVVGNGTSWGTDRSYYRNAAVNMPNPNFNLAAEWTLAGATTAASLTNVDTANNTQTEYLGKHIFISAASISDILSQSIQSNTSTAAIPFTVGGSGTLTATATSSDPTLIQASNIVFDVVSGTATGRTVTLTPVADQIGTALITVTVTDGVGATASDSFQLIVTDPTSTITGVSVVPVDPTVNGLSTTTFAATVTGTGSFSQAVSWSATGGSINALGQWTAPNTAGPFTITATSVQNGAVSGSSTATVVPVNTNPAISDITDQVTVQDTAIANIPFTVGDAETPVASLSVGATSNNTTLIPNANLTFGGSGASRTLTVTPAAGQTGTATITVTVTDGGGATATDTFLVTVKPPPSKVIISQYYEGSSFNKYAELTNVGTTTINLASPQLYIVAINYGGTGGGADPATVSPGGSYALTGTLAPGASRVFKHNSAALPAYAAAAATGVGSTAVNFNGNDIIFLSTSTAVGTGWNNRLDVVGNNLGWVGQDQSFYRKPTILGGNQIFDLAGEWTLAGVDTATSLANVAIATDTMTEYLGVHLFGTAPTISNMADLIVEMNAAIPGIPFTVNDAETNPDNLVFTLTSSNTTLLPNAGITVSGTGSSRTLNLAPTAGQGGTTTVTVSIKDEGNMMATDTFVLTVNAPPVAADQSVSTNEDTALPITLVATDVNGDPLTYTVTGNPTHGSLTGTVPNLTYTPALNYNGPDSLTFKANDGRVDSNIATVSITVVPVNDAPVAVGDSYSMPGGSPFTVPAPGVLGNDSDVDGPSLSAALVLGPAHGSLVLAPNGGFTYTPFASFTGQDSFTYRATDGDLYSNVVTVNLVVKPACLISISGFSPSSGPVGTLVTLTGGNFAGLTSVHFNGVLASFTIISPTQVQATVPAGATSGVIAVSSAICTGRTYQAFTVPTLVPQVMSFLPRVGSVGSQVTITGSSFTGATVVSFNGVPAGFTVVSSTQITATVPAGATTGPVAVTNSYGTGTSGATNFTIR
ncbi:MAG: tandem-95 repeat protein [Holophagaceae bacterium]|nr:tandem-95 repeat protein [Holophagaceae bacterium]